MGTLDTPPQKQFEQKEIQDLYNQVYRNPKYPNDSILKKIDAWNQKTISSNYHHAVIDVAKGGYYTKVSAQKSAELFYHKALKRIPQLVNDSIAERAYVGLGNLYKNNGEYSKAIVYFQKSIKANEFRKDTIRLGGTLASLAQLYVEKGENTKARKQIQKVFSLLQHQKESIPYLIALHTLANIELSEKKFSKAIDLDKTGILIAEKMESEKAMVTFQDNLAQCYLQQKDWKNAEMYFNKNLEIDKKSQNPKWISDTYISLASLNMQQRKWNDAENYIQQAIHILNQNQLPSQSLKAYELLADLFQKKGDLAKAYDAKNQYLKIYQDINTTKKEEAFAEFDRLFEAQEKEKALAETKLALNKKDKQTDIQWLGIIVLLLLLLIGFILFRNHKIKSKLEKQQWMLKNQLLQEQTESKIQKQRLAISRELHDSVGSQLTFIIAILDSLKKSPLKIDELVVQKINTLSAFAQKSIAELRDAIWALNTEQLQWKELSTRILNFVKEASESADEIKFETDFNVNENISFTSKQAINLFRVIQETMNNAIKHAEAHTIILKIILANNRLNIVISDDGKGFDYEAFKRKSYGIGHIEKRIQELNGSFSVDSKIGIGTVYSIQINNAS